LESGTEKKTAGNARTVKRARSENKTNQLKPKTQMKIPKT